MGWIRRVTAVMNELHLATVAIRRLLVALAGVATSAVALIWALETLIQSLNG